MSAVPLEHDDPIFDRLRGILDAQREAFLADVPVTLSVRRDRLDRGLAMLLAHREKLLDAVMQDFPVRNRDWTLLAEIFATSQVFQTARKNLHRWMRPERRQAPPPFKLFGARAEIQYQPLGVVGVMGAWNGPVNLVLVPLATVLAAGNRAMLCPSDLMPATAAALDDAVRAYFDPTEVALVRGGLETSKAFSRLRFDHLLFTGSPGVGNAVMVEAAKNLVPVTLELGGKCPVIVAPDADITDTANELIATKTLNGGQACLAPDLVFVPRAQLETLVQRLDAAAQALYPGAARHPDYCGLVNERNFRRVQSLLDEAKSAGARIAVLGLGGNSRNRADEPQRRLALHLVIDPPQGTRALREEIFGPVMTVIGYDDLDAVCTQLRQGEKPLGLYVFSKRASIKQHVLDRTFSGGVTINDTLFHYSVPDLPFGGVGRSGIGAYSLGVEGFRRFSHARSVYHQAGPRSLLRVLQPPYGRMFDWVVRGSLDRLARKFARIPPRA